ncbi:lysophospholipid acyltransferase family protein [Citreimonas salinaria]|uniref:Lyso-ornithine lipid acyltransferase n=1 Tax=Citreimonas salinaria TaxID=321339 RepID=A0A1H3IR22_9RHOB|nr:lysophospholipid acyltransferase family protein [Citreimonas salinaria]SDY29304.1 lyso-ornithine lipid acyltransferase [Citreimonas salinaria]
MTWTAPTIPAPDPIGPAGWLRAGLRGTAMAGVVFGGLGLLLALRLVERPLAGQGRPVTPWITQGVCRVTLAIMGLRVDRRGTPIRVEGAQVANHTSWLDIFVLNAFQNVYFVSKSEVASWPGIGWLARATGTVFIRRDRREARTQTELFQKRLSEGHRLLFFPEGTSTDGRQVLPFKTTLFAAFYDDALRHDAHIQAISLTYRSPPGARPAFYGWWGDMDFAPSLLEVLAQRRQGRVSLVWHPPVRVDAHPNRKSLASHLEAQVRSGHAAASDHA